MWTIIKFSLTASMVSGPGEVVKHSWWPWSTTYYLQLTEVKKAIWWFSTSLKGLTEFHTKLKHYTITASHDTWYLDNILSYRQPQILKGYCWRFRIEKCTSDQRDPKGSVLCPLLFLLFINDLPDNIGSNTRLFADDCIVYRTIGDLADQNGITRRSCQICRMGRQVGHGISPTKVQYLGQYPERHHITLPSQISLSAKRTHFWDTRHHQGPGHRSPVKTDVEKPHQTNHEEIKQYA